MPSTERVDVRAADSSGASSIAVYYGAFNGFKHPSYSGSLDYDVGLVHLLGNAVANFPNHDVQVIAGSRPGADAVTGSGAITPEA